MLINTTNNMCLTSFMPSSYEFVAYNFVSVYMTNINSHSLYSLISEILCTELVYVDSLVELKTMVLMTHLLW